MTRGRSEKPPSICRQVIFCPMRGSHSSQTASKSFSISEVLVFHRVFSLLSKDSASIEGVALACKVEPVTGVNRLKSVLIETTKRPFESPKKILKMIPKAKRKR